MDQLSSLTKDVENMPDLKYVVDTLTDIFEYISTDEMLSMRKDNKTEYDRMMEGKYKDFEDRYFSLFRVILDGEFDSMNHLVMMIKTLCLVKTGKISNDAAYANIREELSNHYIYPQFGGKKEFEKEMNRRNKKTKRGKHI